MDAIKESREAVLGATRDGFMNWCMGNTEYGKRLIETAFSVNDSRLEQALRERHWGDYLEDLEFAYAAERRN